MQGRRKMDTSAQPDKALNAKFVIRSLFEYIRGKNKEKRKMHIKKVHMTSFLLNLMMSNFAYRVYSKGSVSVLKITNSFF